MGKPAATVTSMHVCPKVTSKVPHVGGPVIAGSGNVTIGGLPAARKGDKLICIGPPDTIKEGSSTVKTNGKPASRLGDGTAHGGKLVIGNPTVLIGDNAPSSLTSLFTPAGTTPYTGNYTPPVDREDAEGRLNIARSYIKENASSASLKPRFADNEMLAKAASGDLGDNVAVRIIDSQYAKPDGYLGPTADDGSVRSWITSFACLEQTGGDPELMADYVGIAPGGDYHIALLDLDGFEGDSTKVSFVPTNDRMAPFAESELEECYEGDAQAVLTDAYRPTYRAAMDAMEEGGYDRNDDEKVDDFCNDYFAEESERQLFKKRLLLHNELGANKYFTGNGCTEITNPDAGQKYGTMEVYLVDRAPKTLSEMDNLLLIKATPL